MIWGPVMFLSQIQDNLETGTETYWGGIGAGSLLVFDLEVAVLGFHLIACPWRGKHKISNLWVGKLTAVSADSFRFGASFTVGGKNKICRAP